MENLIIIGSGPAGLTAAIYAGRAGLSPLVIAGYQQGGQLMLTSDVENFPGFPDPVPGPSLMMYMRAQAERFGVRFVDRDATAVDFSGNSLRIVVEEETFECRAVIVATGATAQWLGLESETRLRGKGVSACATCDGLFFKDKKVLVVGGGDAAMEEALYLTRIASSVTVVHRRDEFRASRIMQERVLAHPKINVVWDSVVDEILGVEGVAGAVLRNVKTQEKREVPCDGVFVAIGHHPNTDIFKDVLALDPLGYIAVKNETETSVAGVFAAGDVCDPRYRQAITAAGAGCRAVLDVERYLDSLG